MKELIVKISKIRDELRKCYVELDDLNNLIDVEEKDLEKCGVDFYTITRIGSSYIFALKSLGDAIMHIEDLTSHLEKLNR